jgi:putative transcriptional regulator
MSKLFKDLKAGLEDAIAHKRGRINLRSELIEIPEASAEYQSQQIRRIREENQYSQSV